MESVNCNICSNSDAEFFRLVECMSPKQAQFKLMRCKTCGLIYLEPRPTKQEMQDFYVYWPDAAKKSYFPTKKVWQAQRRKIKLLSNSINKTGGKILDVGTGSGEFLKLMADNGWKVFGIEYGKSSSGFARESLGLNVLTGDMLENNFQSNFFDVVTFWDSLEHLYGPKEALLETRRILKDDGVLLISLPNIDNLAALIFKGAWYTNIPRHLYQFSSRTIKMLLEKSGFRPFKIIYTPGFFEPVGFVVTFKIWLEGKLKKTQVRQTDIRQDRRDVRLPEVFKNIIRVLLEIIFLPLSIISLILKKAPNMIILAKKC